MDNKELIKRFEFDLRFKYNPAYFVILNKEDLNLIIHIIIEEFNLKTNLAYVEYMLETDFRIDCTVLIDLENHISDVYSTNTAIYMEHISEKDLLLLPDYIKSYRIE